MGIFVILYRLLSGSSQLERILVCLPHACSCEPWRERPMALSLLVKGLNVQRGTITVFYLLLLLFLLLFSLSLVHLSLKLTLSRMGCVPLSLSLPKSSQQQNILSVF